MYSSFAKIKLSSTKGEGRVGREERGLRKGSKEIKGCSEDVRLTEEMFGGDLRD